MTRQIPGEEFSMLKEQQVQKPYSRRMPIVLRISKEAGISGRSEGEHGKMLSKRLPGPEHTEPCSHREERGSHDE